MSDFLSFEINYIVNYFDKLSCCSLAISLLISSTLNEFEALLLPRMYSTSLATQPVLSSFLLFPSRCILSQSTCELSPRCLLWGIHTQSFHWHFYICASLLTYLFNAIFYAMHFLCVLHLLVLSQILYENPAEDFKCISVAWISKAGTIVVITHTSLSISS